MGQTNQKATTKRFDDVLFHIAPKKIAVLGGVTAPAGAAGSLTVEVRRAARQIALLNAALWSALPGTVAARMTVEYADGSRAATDFVMGQTTASWLDDAPALRAPTAWKAQSPAGTPLALRVTRWDNPHPQRVIARLRFEPVDAETGWALAGLTLLH